MKPWPNASSLNDNGYAMCTVTNSAETRLVCTMQNLRRVHITLTVCLRGASSFYTVFQKNGHPSYFPS